MKKYLWLIPVILVGVAIVAITVQANPSFFASSAMTATATTSPTYLYASGAATTTLVYDSLELNGDNQTNQGNYWRPEFATLKTYFNASSTDSVLKIYLQFSDNKIDWYENNVETYAAGAITLATANSYSWTFGSTTPHLYTSGTLTRGLKVIKIPTPLRYVRVVFHMTGQNGSVWAEVVPIKEQSR